MLILLLKKEDVADPGIRTWLSEIEASTNVALVLQDHATLDGVSQLFSADMGKAVSAKLQANNVPANNTEKILTGLHARDACVLTHRQSDILLLIKDGLSNKVIAHRIGVSVDTVRGDLKKMFRILGVKNRTSAALLHVKVGSRV